MTDRHTRMSWVALSTDGYIHHSQLHMDLYLNYKIRIDDWFFFFLWWLHYCNFWPRNCVKPLLIIIIKHKYVHIFILWLMSLLVYNGYYRFNKAGLLQEQQSMFSLYPKLLQLWGVHIHDHMRTCRSRSNTQFVLYIIIGNIDYNRPCYQPWIYVAFWEKNLLFFQVTHQENVTAECHKLFVYQFVWIGLLHVYPSAPPYHPVPWPGRAPSSCWPALLNETASLSSTRDRHTETERYSLLV